MPFSLGNLPHLDNFSFLHFVTVDESLIIESLEGEETINAILSQRTLCKYLTINDEFFSMATDGDLSDKKIALRTLLLSEDQDSLFQQTYGRLIEKCWTIFTICHHLSLVIIACDAPEDYRCVAVLAAIVCLQANLLIEDPRPVENIKESIKMLTSILSYKKISEYYSIVRDNSTEFARSFNHFLSRVCTVPHEVALEMVVDSCIGNYTICNHAFQDFHQSWERRSNWLSSIYDCFFPNDHED